jgi:hypothetical protein
MREASYQHLNRPKQLEEADRTLLVLQARAVENLLEQLDK